MVSLLICVYYRAYIRLQQRMYCLSLCKSGVLSNAAQIRHYRTQNDKIMPFSFIKKINHNFLNDYQGKYHQVFSPACNLNTLLKQSINFVSAVNFGVNCYLTIQSDQFVLKFARRSRNTFITQIESTKGKKELHHTKESGLENF